jgi:hypothetical protein
MAAEENLFLQSLKNTWLSESDTTDQPDRPAGPPPSRSPFLSDLIFTYRKMLEGTSTVDDLKKQVTSLSERLDIAMNGFRQMYNSPFGSADLKKVAQKIMNAYESHHKGLREIEKYFPNHLESYLINGIKTCEEATDELFAANDELKALQDEASMRNCLQCGTRNPPERKYCRKCGMEFPLINQAMRPQDGGSAESTKAGRDILTGGTSIPTTYTAIFDGIEKIKRGEISNDDYIQRIEDVLSMFREARPQVIQLLTRQVTQIPVEQDVKDAVLENGKVLTDGIDDAIAGMEELMTYVNAKSSKALFNGWNRMMSGGQQVLIAQARYGEMHAMASAGTLGTQVAASGEEHLQNFTREEIHFGGDEDE